jgi:hypothetical protein
MGRRLCALAEDIEVAAQRGHCICRPSDRRGKRYKEGNVRDATRRVSESARCS